jgi:hypothetical protein
LEDDELNESMQSKYLIQHFHNKKNNYKGMKGGEILRTQTEEEEDEESSGSVSIDDLSIKLDHSVLISGSKKEQLTNKKLNKSILSHSQPKIKYTEPKSALS